MKVESEILRKNCHPYYQWVTKNGGGKIKNKLIILCNHTLITLQLKKNLQIFFNHSSIVLQSNFNNSSIIHKSNT